MGAVATPTPDQADLAQPGGAAAVLQSRVPQPRRRSREPLFDRTWVGRALFYGTLALFALLVALAGGRSAGSAGVCDLAPFGDPTATVLPHTIDVSETAMRIGDGVCVRVAAAGGPPRPEKTGTPRTWHLLLDGAEVAQATGPDPRPGRPVRLPFVLPAPTSASGSQAEVIASLWTAAWRRRPGASGS